MLPKHRRIKKSLFSKVFSIGERVVTPHFLVYRVSKTAQEPSQFAFSISKKICKTAVARNRYRRQGYAIISKHLSDITPGFLFVFGFKKGSYPVSFSELEQEIVSVLHK